jgi:hypothetical protein
MMERERITTREAFMAAGQEHTSNGSDTTGDEAKNAEEKGDNHAQKSPDPLGTSNTQQKLVLLDPPADRDPPAASSSLNPTDTDMSNTLSQQTTHKLSPPREIAPLAWFQFPQKIRNPYTGRMVQAPTPPCLQEMMQDLQDQEDWFETPDDASTQQKAPA